MVHAAHLNFDGGTGQYNGAADCGAFLSLAFEYRARSDVNSRLIFVRGFNHGNVARVVNFKFVCFWESGVASRDYRIPEDGQNDGKTIVVDAFWFAEGVAELFVGDGGQNGLVVQCLHN